jgi:hypothetical protein
MWEALIMHGEIISEKPVVASSKRQEEKSHSAIEMAQYIAH